MIFLYYNVFVIKVIFIFFLEKLAPVGGYGFTKSEIQILACLMYYMDDLLIVNIALQKPLVEIIEKTNEMICQRGITNKYW